MNTDLHLLEFYSEINTELKIVYSRAMLFNNGLKRLKLFIENIATF